MQLLKILTTIFFVVLISLNLYAKEPDRKTRPLTEEEIQLIKDNMDTELLDGESARYKFPELILTETEEGKKHGDKYCGLVNSKNSYGAYSGYSTFLTMFRTRTDTGKTGIILILVDSGNGVVTNMCRQAGYQI